MFGYIAGIISEMLFPRKCALCDDSGIGSVNSFCPKCESFLKQSVVALNNYQTSDRAVYWDSLYSVFSYKDSIPKIVHLFKSGRRIDLGRYFAHEMYNILCDLSVKIDIIIPVPSSRKKVNVRGFYPSEKLAKNIQKLSGIVSKRYLREKYRNREQKKLAVIDRHIKTIGRFEFYGNFDFQGKTVLLVDDVITTGATMNECSRVLKKMGAKAVFSLTIARVDDNKNSNIAV